MKQQGWKFCKVLEIAPEFSSSPCSSKKERSYPGKAWISSITETIPKPLLKSILDVQVDNQAFEAPAACLSMLSHVNRLPSKTHTHLTFKVFKFQHLEIRNPNHSSLTCDHDPDYCLLGQACLVNFNSHSKAGVFKYLVMNLGMFGS